MINTLLFAVIIKTYISLNFGPIKSRWPHSPHPVSHYDAKVKLGSDLCLFNGSWPLISWWRENTVPNKNGVHLASSGSRLLYCLTLLSISSRAHIANTASCWWPYLICWGMARITMNYCRDGCFLCINSGYQQSDVLVWPCVIQANNVSFLKSAVKWWTWNEFLLYCFGHNQLVPAREALYIISKK